MPRTKESGIPPTTRLGLMTPSETDAYVAALRAERDALREALEDIAAGRHDCGCASCTKHATPRAKTPRAFAHAALERPE